MRQKRPSLQICGYSFVAGLRQFARAADELAPSSVTFSFWGRLYLFRLWGGVQGRDGDGVASESYPQAAAKNQTARPNLVTPRPL